MDWQKLSDRELVELCLRTNSEDAWKELVRRFQPLLAGVIAKTLRRWMLPNRSLVDDLVQDSLRKLFENQRRAMREFRWLHDNSFRGFLKVVASNATQDYIRKHPPSRPEEALEEADAVLTKPEPLHHKVEIDALVQKIIACLQKLLSAEENLKRDLAMFLLYYRYGFTAKQISGLYPLTVKAVENTLLRLVRIARTRCI